MPRLFGTNGVRGVVGSAMTPELAMDLARALGTWLQRDAAPGAPAPTVAIGRDHRTSGPLLSAATAAGLMTTGCHVLDAGPVPTPALQYAVKIRDEVAAGVLITASHNPPEFNGIKFGRGDGREMQPDEEEEIEAIYFARRFRAATWDAHGTIRPLPGVIERYHEAITARVDVAAIRRAGLSVVVDTANGAACGSLPALLRSLGCGVITLNAQPDGTFPGHPSEPVAENAGPLQALVRETGADLGVLVDGDADRAVFIDEKGVYHAGDRSLAIFAAHAVRRAGGGTVCTPVSTSSCVEEAVTAVGGQVSYTIVGSPKVAEAMVREGAVFGGEENGGLIFPDHQHTRDGAMAAAAMVELLAVTAEPLSVHVARVPVKHVAKLKIDVDDGAKLPLLRALQGRIAQGGPVGVDVRSVDDRDGVKAYVDGGWVLVRPSGTEPIVRIYAESGDEKQARALAETFVRLLRDLKETLPTTV